jgi:uncharacterized ParB-like nuclease family protein
MDKNFAPKMVQLKVSDLKIDSTYQRAECLKAALVNSIVKNFNPHLLGVLIVSQRGNDYYVIDGQHRLEALKHLGIETVWCSSEIGMTRKTEAEEFINYNSRRYNLTQASMFKAQITSGDEEAIKINSMLSRYYFKIDGKSKYRSQNGSNTVNAVKVVKMQFAKMKEEEFDRLFALLRVAWNGDSVSLDGRIISGLGLMIRKCGPYFTNKEFVEKLGRKEATEILRVGHAFKGSSSDSDKAYALAILQLYNAGKTTRRIPENLIYDN